MRGDGYLNIIKEAIPYYSEWWGEGAGWWAHKM